jgi:aminoglycoside phosphotransferase family enzyme
MVRTVAALSRPESYPDHPSSIERIETHMSWVFLTPSRAYKLEKPIRTDAFDHRSVAARHRGCATELRLNRRLAPDVYLALVPVMETTHGLRVDGWDGGEVVDWLIEMRRLPRDRMLDVQIAAGGVEAESIDLLADTLTDFFIRGERIGFGPLEYRAHIAADLADKRACLVKPRYGLPLAEIDAIHAGQQDWLRAHARLLESRAARVIDGHGDLRPEHVCLERPPVVIDCLEFAASLRRLDPVSELGFLGLECRRLGAAWIGDRLLRRYGARSGDHVGPELVRFYQSQHALIRAAIAVWHLDDETLTETERWQARAREYLGLGVGLFDA